MLASRFFLTYFSVELVFGVPHHFGLEDDEVVPQIADILRHGMVPAEATAKMVPETRRRARTA